jgi:fatty-acyl-CoA synthase
VTHMTHMRLDYIIRRHAWTVGDRVRVAVVDGDTEVTFADLDERAQLMARRLRASGVGPGDRVLILMENRLEWFDLLFGCSKLGAVMVPANNFSVGEELRYFIEDSGAALVVSDDALGPALDFLARRKGSAIKFITVDAGRRGWTRLDSIDVEGTPPVDEMLPPDAPFLLQYTSGTTGRPKAAVHTQSTLLFNTFGMMHEGGITKDDVYLLTLALCWSAGFYFFTLATMLAGGRVVMYPNLSGIIADDLAAAWRAHGVTLASVVPVVMRRLTEGDIDPASLSSIRLMVTGSEPVAAATLEKMCQLLPECELVHGYGMSEAPASVLMLRGEHAMEKVGSVGKPTVLYEVRIVSASGDDVAPGEVGEIVIRSANTAQEYWKRPDETAEAFAGGWFHSGDLARMDDEGFIFLAGRSKDMIISGGINIYPAEIERTLGEHPAVREVAVVGVPDERWGESPVAVVVSDDDVSGEELAQFAAKRLAKYKVPKQWHFRETALPRTVSGKVQKFQVRESILRS